MTLEFIGRSVSVCHLLYTFPSLVRDVPAGHQLVYVSLHQLARGLWEFAQDAIVALRSTQFRTVVEDLRVGHKFGQIFPKWTILGLFKDTFSLLRS